MESDVPCFHDTSTWNKYGGKQSSSAAFGRRDWFWCIAGASWWAVLVLPAMLEGLRDEECKWTYKSKLNAVAWCQDSSFISGEVFFVFAERQSLSTSEILTRSWQDVLLTLHAGYPDCSLATCHGLIFVQQLELRSWLDFYMYIYIYVILYPLQHWLPADLLQIPQITQKFDCAPKCEGPWKIAHPLAFVLRGSIVWYFLLMHFCSAWWWPPVKPLKMRTGSEGFEGFDPGPDLLKGTGVGLAWAAWTARALCCFGHWRYGRPRVGQQNFV